MIDLDRLLKLRLVVARFGEVRRGDDGYRIHWSHLAMRLWPERVVPKCAEDRSLAVAHGLEDVFWVEGADGTWTARKRPTKDVDAPTAQGVGRKPRKGKAQCSSRST